VNSFSIFIGLGTLLGLLMAGWRAPKKETLRYVDAAVLALFIALIVSRAFAVAASWGYYSSHFVEVFQVWLGGLSSIGALAGGVLAIFVISFWWKLPAGLLADTLFPLVGALGITSWLGCWFNACSYGSLSHAWWALEARDEWGVMASRIPVQLIGAILTLVIVWLMDWAARRLTIPGLTACFGLFGISALIFAISYLRADPMPIWDGLRLEAWGAIGVMVLSSLLAVVLLVHWKYKKSPIPNRRVS
jgi:prolipoprotein diacylglyceryltransferase